MPLELIYGLCIVALAVGIAYAMRQYRTRNRANDAVGQAATREQYKHPERYEQEEKRFKEKVRPS